MYSRKSGLILAFHGCCKTVQEKIVRDSNEQLEPSRKDYDWLGHGVYFWEHNYERAMEWAVEAKSKGRVKEPAVIGAVIDLGHCLDLLDSKHLKMLKIGYDTLKATLKKSGKDLPKNSPLKKSQDLLLRHLDCAVIETVHSLTAKADDSPFDSVRGVFFEGKNLYKNAGFKEKNHIQLAIINRNCIKGYFIPRVKNSNL